MLQGQVYHKYKIWAFVMKLNMPRKQKLTIKYFHNYNHEL